jgi:hypothetical protein
MFMVRKRCQPPNLGKLRRQVTQVSQIWWLAPFFFFLLVVFREAFGVADVFDRCEDRLHVR